MALVTSILKQAVVLGQEDIAIMRGHLRMCCARHVGASEFSATLQAVEVLVQGKQLRAVIECGLALWLVESMEELAGMEGNMLDRVMEVLIQTVSLFLVCGGEGIPPLSDVRPSLLCSMLCRYGRLGVKGHCGVGSSALLAVLSFISLLPTTFLCQGEREMPVAAHLIPSLTSHSSWTQWRPCWLLLATGVLVITSCCFAVFRTAWMSLR